jgi:hypothetical protein
MTLQAPIHSYVTRSLKLTPLREIIELIRARPLNATERIVELHIRC